MENFTTMPMAMRGSVGIVGRTMRPFAVIATTGLLAGCQSTHSALQSAGREAREMAALFWVLGAAGAIIWTVMMALLLYALYFKPRIHAERTASLLVWIGGLAIPATGIVVLVIYTLPMMPSLRAQAGQPTIEVVGELYWWRVRYRLSDGRVVETANELHLPVGQRTDLALTSPDVIHSLWIPALAGKMDMIPGRTNRIALEPEREGRYGGICAELCGESHSFMRFEAVVQSPDALARWLGAQAADANPPATPEEKRGAALFHETGCGACHTIRGTQAEGRSGPDLTHVGSRERIAGGLLPNNQGTLAGWIAASQDLKPGNKMPSFAVLPGDDLRALAAYLAALK
ncbi:MAG: cytochrome B [Methylobacterium sp.]|nr:MAG: cytochrome B [Methylobacterium sp.]